jgi:two-component system, NarL family, response regulator
MSAKTRIILADDHALFRDGLKSLLKHEPDLMIVAEVDRIEKLAAVLDETPCDLLLLDLQMERSALLEIETLAARLRIVVVTASELVGDAVAAIRLGARAVVFKRFAVGTLIEAIRCVVGGEIWMPPNVQTLLASRLQHPEAIPLTPREQEVVRLVALGLRNSEVATRLFVSEQTVKSHLNHVFEKLGLRDRVALAGYAIRTGIVGPHEFA